MPKKLKFRFKERSRPIYSVQIFEKNQDAEGQMLYALLAWNATSSPTTSLGRVWYTRKKETDYVTMTFRSGSGLARLELRPLNGQALQHWVCNIE